MCNTNSEADIPRNPDASFHAGKKQHNWWIKQTENNEMYTYHANAYTIVLH